jgi:hypothetical protein
MMEFHPDGTPKTPHCYCPRCGYRLDAASAAMPGRSLPQEGDLTICMDCTHVMCFNADLSLREVPQHEIDAMPLDEVLELMAAVSSLRRFWKTHPEERQEFEARRRQDQGEG